MVSFVYFSDLIGRPVSDVMGVRIGKVLDFVISPTGEKFPEVSHLIVKTDRGSFWKLPWSSINRIDKQISLSVQAEKVGRTAPSKKDILLSKVLLDKQIVDTDGLKVVRVNDIVLSEVGRKLCVVSIDVGTRGLLRRLNSEWLANALALKETLLPWGYAEPIEKTLREVKIRLSKRKVADLHPADIASVVTELSAYESDLLMKGLDREKLADTIAKMDKSARKNFFERLSSEDAGKILKELPPDEAADVISGLSEDYAKEIFAKMPSEFSQKVADLVRYSEASVGSIMTTSFFKFPLGTTVGDALSAMRRRPDTKVFGFVYLVDEYGKPKGACSLKRLFLAKKGDKIEDIAPSTKLIKVSSHANKSKAAKLMAKYDFLTLAVVDSRGKLKGVVTADDAIEGILPSRIAGKIPHFLMEGGSR